MNDHRYKLLIFDLDGTLVDSFPGIQLGLNRALEENRLPPRDLDWVRCNVGWGLRRLIGAAVGGGDRVETVLESFRGHYAEVLVEHSPPYPGVNRMLEVLGRERALAVASNKPLPWVESLIEHLGWRPLLAAVVGPETTGKYKPDPAMIHEILRLTGCKPGETLLVGDMPVDAETGRKAGLQVVGVTTGNADAKQLRESGCIAVLESASELPGFLQQRIL